MTNQSPSPLAVGAREAAAMLAISRRTLWGLTAPRGPIPACKVGGRVLYRVTDLEKYLAKLASESMTQPAAGEAPASTTPE